MERVDLQKSVPNVPTFEEYFGLIDDELDDYDFDSDVDDEEIKKMIILMLSLLEDFYVEHKYYSEYDVLTDKFKKELDDFNTELKESLMILFGKYIATIHQELDVEYGLPHELVSFDVDIEKVIDAGIDAVTNTLYADLKDKAEFYREMAITTGMFSLHSNFRRAIKKLANVVNFNAQHIAKLIERDYLELVYGQEALFDWVCSGINTCAWCYEIEASSPLPLSMLPVDHPNGRCVVKPHNPNQYSDEYKRIIGE